MEERVEALEKALKEKDALLATLLERIDALESWKKRTFVLSFSINDG